jgi:hypothetical protein
MSYGIMQNGIDNDRNNITPSAHENNQKLDDISKSLRLVHYKLDQIINFHSNSFKTDDDFEVPTFPFKSFDDLKELDIKLQTDKNFYKNMVTLLYINS